MAISAFRRLRNWENVLDLFIGPYRQPLAFGVRVTVLQKSGKLRVVPTVEFEWRSFVTS